MNAERWERVEQLYHAALDRNASQRAAFLAGACAGDESLRQEVESLLDREHSAEDFLAGFIFTVIFSGVILPQSIVVEGNRAPTTAPIAIVDAEPRGR